MSIKDTAEFISRRTFWNLLETTIYEVPEFNILINQRDTLFKVI